jgi:hypothetical protein
VTILNQQTLAQISADVRRSCYDRRCVRTGIAHIGVGAAGQPFTRSAAACLGIDRAKAAEVHEGAVLAIYDGVLRAASLEGKQCIANGRSLQAAVDSAHSAPRRPRTRR